MLESLKDLYISHPFLPVADAPVWFSHIKDIRCVLVYDAVKNILEYKNGNYVRAWVVGITDAGMAKWWVQYLLKLAAAPRVISPKNKTSVSEKFVASSGMK